MSIKEREQSVTKSSVHLDSAPPLDAYFGLPREVQFCKRCVISNQRPSSVVELKNTGKERKPTIAFDEEGVCSACRFAESKANTIDWTGRERELIDLFDRHRRTDGRYDCSCRAAAARTDVYALTSSGTSTGCTRSR